MNLEKSLKEFFKKIKLNEPTISTLLGALVIFVVGILIFNYFKAEQIEEATPLEVLEETAISPEEEEAGVQLVEKETATGEKAFTKIYKVVEGDYLSKISEKIYGSGQYWPEIAQENSLANPDLLAVGQELTLPDLNLPVEETSVMETPQQVDTKAAISGDQYMVVKGDYLWEIAIRAYGDGYKWPEIAQANNLVNPNYIEVGQELTLPR